MKGMDSKNLFTDVDKRTEPVQVQKVYLATKCVLT